MGILGSGFYVSNNPTNSVKALKEDRVLRITECGGVQRMKEKQPHFAKLLQNKKWLLSACQQPNARDWYKGLVMMKIIQWHM